MNSTGTPKATIPIFPPELEREIFEIATLQTPTHGPSFVLVAKRVQYWIEPLLYESVKSDTSGGATPLESLVRCGVHVRRLLIRSIGSDLEDRIETQIYLSKCPNVVDLAVWNSGADESILPLIEALPLRRLSVNLYSVFGGYNGFLKHVAAGLDKSSIFSHLTHLDILSDISNLEEWKAFAQLPRLSYLSISPFNEENRKCLQHLPGVKMLIMVGVRIQSSPVVILPRGNDDIRLVRCLVPDFGRDWLQGGYLFGGRNSWDFGEEAMLARSGASASVS